MKVILGRNLNQVTLRAFALNLLNLLKGKFYNKKFCITKHIYISGTQVSLENPQMLTLMSWGMNISTFVLIVKFTLAKKTNVDIFIIPEYLLVLTSQVLYLQQRIHCCH